MIYIIISIIIIFLGVCSIYYHNKYLDYKKTVSYLNYCDKSIRNILFSDNLDSDEKIIMIKKEYDNEPF